MRFWLKMLLAAMVVTATAIDPVEAQQRKTPYYASIAPTKARMRTGPGRNYPASWLYRRVDLPVKVVAAHDGWLKVEDPSGTQGWMLANLVSDVRTAIVVGTTSDLLDQPRFSGRLLWRVAPNVVGRISRCARGWCWFDVRGRAGYVEANRLWGVDREEELP